MSRTVSLSTLVTRVRSRGGFLSGTITDTNLKDWISESVAELYDLIVECNPDFYLDTQTITVTSGTAAYTLTAATYKIIGVDVLDTNGYWRNIQRVNFANRNRCQSQTSDKSNAQYIIKGTTIRLIPTPGWSGSIRTWYIPTPTALTADDNTFDDIAGWSEYVVADVLCKCAAFEESDMQPFLIMKQEAEKKIRAMAAQKDIGEPERVRDVDQEYGFNYLPSFNNP